MKKILLILLLIFISCRSLFEKEEVPVTEVYQTIKRTCDLPNCYYALYTTVYFKGAEVKKWIDDAQHITPEGVRGRKAEGDSLIGLFKKLKL